MWTIWHSILAYKSTWNKESRLPTPMGLIEYTAAFFTASSLQQVIIILYSFGTYEIFLQISRPPDYRSWLQTLYVLFGCKFPNIFCGPMWGYEPIMQSQVNQPMCANPMNPQNVFWSCASTYMYLSVPMCIMYDKHLWMYLLWVREQ